MPPGKPNLWVATEEKPVTKPTAGVTATDTETSIDSGSKSSPATETVMFCSVSLLLVFFYRDGSLGYLPKVEQVKFELETKLTKVVCVHTLAIITCANVFYF